MPPKQKRDGNAAMYSAKTAKSANKKKSREKSADYRSLAKEKEKIVADKRAKIEELEQKEKNIKSQLTDLKKELKNIKVQIKQLKSEGKVSVCSSKKVDMKKGAKPVKIKMCFNKK